MKGKTDQLMAIAGALDKAGEDWNYSLDVKKKFGEHTYIIVISHKGRKLDFTSKLPVHVDAEDRSYWTDKIKEANMQLECGAFSLSDNGKAICYSVYSLSTNEEEVKDEATVLMLLESCYTALEKFAEPMMAQTKKKGLVEGFLNMIGLVANDEDE